MPCPIDLTGKRFGKLIAVRLLDERGPYRERRWLCQCDCGNTNIVSTGVLQGGKTKSCGCFRGPYWGPWTKKKARAEHKSKMILVEGGEEWYAPRKAAIYAKTTQHTLQRWRASCPWLNGQGLRTRELGSGYGRIITYYARKELDRVIDAQAARSPIPDFPGLVYIYDAAKDLRFSTRTLRRRMKVARVTVIKKSAKSTDGRALPRRYIPLDFVNQEKAKQTGYDVPDAKISCREAANILGKTKGAVYALVHRGILKLTEAKFICKGGYPRKGKLFSRKAVEALVAKQEIEEGRNYREEGIARAMKFLKEYLADGPKLRSEILKAAANVGVFYIDLYPARRKMQIRSRRAYKCGPGQWYLPGTLTPAMECRGVKKAELFLKRILAKGPKIRKEIEAEARKQKVDYVSLSKAKIQLGIFGVWREGCCHWQLPEAPEATSPKSSGATFAETNSATPPNLMPSAASTSHSGTPRQVPAEESQVLQEPLRTIGTQRVVIDSYDQQARKENYQVADYIIKGITEKKEPRNNDTQDFTPVEKEILSVFKDKNEILTGNQIARRLKCHSSSHFRGVLSNLVKRDVLKTSGRRKGYQLGLVRPCQDKR